MGTKPGLLRTRKPRCRQTPFDFPRPEKHLLYQIKALSQASNALGYLNSQEYTNACIYIYIHIHIFIYVCMYIRCVQTVALLRTMQKRASHQSIRQFGHAAGPSRWSRKSSDHRLLGSRRPSPTRTSPFQIATPCIFCLISHPSRTRNPADIRFIEAPWKYLTPERFTLPKARPHKMDHITWPLAAAAETSPLRCNPRSTLASPVTQ